jgi:16S rRNA (guanine527-N7)-methyltransferase
VRAGSQPPGVRARLEGLAARYELPTCAVDKLQALLDLVSSDALAPTSVRDPARAVDDHVADSLVALELAETRAAATICDLGAGPGFPGLPLAAALPEADVDLVESSSRKCAFIARGIVACGLANATVVHARAEDWANGAKRYDLVTARALAPLEVVAEYGAPLLRVGGTLMVWRGRRDERAEAAASVAAAELGLELSEPRAVMPYDGAEHRHLHLMSKVRETSDRFPRRPGIAVKRPLGSDRAPSDRGRR